MIGMYIMDSISFVIVRDWLQNFSIIGDELVEIQSSFCARFLRFFHKFDGITNWLYTDEVE